MKPQRHWQTSAVIQKHASLYLMVTISSCDDFEDVKMSSGRGRVAVRNTYERHPPFQFDAERTCYVPLGTAVELRLILHTDTATK
jgi:hypothetical protein